MGTRPVITLYGKNSSKSLLRHGFKGEFKPIFKHLVSILKNYRHA